MPIDNLTRRSRLAIASAIVVSVGGMLLLILEMPALVNTMGAAQLAGMGFMAGSGELYLLYRGGLATALPEKQRGAGLALLLVGLFAASTALLSHLNHRGGHEAAAEPVTVLDKAHQEHTRKRDEYWKLRVRYHEKEKWIDVSPAEWAQVEVGQAYQARVIAGAFGYPVLACPGSCR